MNHAVTCLRCGAPLVRNKSGRTRPCTCAPSENDADAPRLPLVPMLLGAVGLLVCAGALLVYAATQRSSPDSPPVPLADPAPPLTAIPVVTPEPEQAVLSMPRQAEPSDAAPVDESPLPLLHLPAVEPDLLHMPTAIKETSQRRNRAGETDLLRQLAVAEEVGLGKSGRSVYESYVRNIVRNGSKAGSKGLADSSAVLRLRPDLGLLGLRDGPHSMLPPKASAELSTLSRKLRAYLQLIAPTGPNGEPRDLAALRERMRIDLRGKRPEWLRGEAVPALNQLLMAEDAPTRGLLVEALAAIQHPAATRALVQRAVYDLHPDVRTRAVEALRGRDPETWRPLMMKAFSYPWSPPADFAAEALVTLKDTGAVSELIAKLRDPHPGRPIITPDRRVVIREVVKVSHNHNCMLCHAPAVSGNEPVIGIDPVNTRPLDPLAKGPGYQERKNPAAAAAATVNAAIGKQRVPNWVRADITFLKQDFSVSFPLPAPLAPVRFDYVVRTRPLDGPEYKRWKGIPEVDNPQREAMLFALRELTGNDYGTTTAAWVKAYPEAEPDARAAKLVERLVRAEPLARLGMMQTFQAGKGVEYTWALARAIPKLAGPAQETARLTLAQRLEKLSGEELEKWLEDRDPEIRRAAGVAEERRRKSSAED